MNSSQRRRSSGPLRPALRFLFWVVVALVEQRGAATLSQPPHILFLLADDLGWNDVSFHNGGEGQLGTNTSCIDKLCASGTRLDQYFTNPICTPSRASILTGRHVIRYGLQHGSISDNRPTHLPVDEVLLPQLLRDAGYTTWMLGKWHLGGAYPNVGALRAVDANLRSAHDLMPMSRGFDHFYGHLTVHIDGWSHVLNSDCDPRQLWVGPCGHDWHRNNESCPEDAGVKGTSEGFTAHLIVRELADLLQRRRRSTVKKPLFVYVPFHMVHGPLQCPKSYLAPFAHIVDIRRRKKAGMLAVLDEAVANVTGLFRAHGLWRDTLAIFTSDNGAPSIRGGGSNWPLRGQKHDLWDGGVRVPACIVGGSARLGVPAGVRTRAIVAHLDWLPTLLGRATTGDDAARANRGADAKALDGFDVWESIVGAPTVASPRYELLHNVEPPNNEHDAVSALRMVLPSLNSYGTAQANRTWKLLSFANGSKVLIDTENDESESRDVSAQNARTTRFMSQRLGEWASEAAPCWGNPTHGFDCDKHPPVDREFNPLYWGPEPSSCPNPSATAGGKCPRALFEVVDN